MWNSVSQITKRPAVFVAVSVVGCLMLWLACKQVKSTIDVLIHLQVLNSTQMSRLSDKPRYCLFGIFTLVYVWLDLMLLKLLLKIAKVVLRCCKKIQRARKIGGSNHDVNSRKKSAEPVRKNPVRARRGVNKRFMFDE